MKFVSISLIFFSFISVLDLSFNHYFINVHGHSLFGNNNGSEVQIQKKGSIQVELSTFPPKPLLDANTNVFLRITSSAGDEPVDLRYPIIGKRR
ncbi:MAG TPA: hypothetical protein VER14_05210 [Phototrophicaceae bacterium]|nr:hypothetical protein [Phototrophicaceae bacterium]